MNQSQPRRWTASTVIGLVVLVALAYHLFFGLVVPLVGMAVLGMIGAVVGFFILGTVVAVGITAYECLTDKTPPKPKTKV